MQAQIRLEQDDVVIRFPKNLISQEALANLLGFIEFTALTQKDQSQQEAVLATKIQREVSQSMDYAFLNDDVWQGETMTKDLADNHVQI